jgi:hypothetical protein
MRPPRASPRARLGPVAAQASASASAASQGQAPGRANSDLQGLILIVEILLFVTSVRLR